MNSSEELGERWRAIFEILTSGTRRQIIGTLLENPPSRVVALPEGANNPEYRIDPETLSTDLVHRHLPTMAQAGFIEWEETPFCVRRGPRFDEVAAVILAIDTYDDVPEYLTDGCYFHEQNGAET